MVFVNILNTNINVLKVLHTSRIVYFGYFWVNTNLGPRSTSRTSHINTYSVAVSTTIFVFQSELILRICRYGTKMKF